MVNCVGNMVCREVKLDMLEENIVPEKSATPFLQELCVNTGCVYLSRIHHVCMHRP